MYQDNYHVFRSLKIYLYFVLILPDDIPALTFLVTRRTLQLVLFYIHNIFTSENSNFKSRIQYIFILQDVAKLPIL